MIGLLRADGAVDPPTAPARLAAYRIVQEALTNAAKHAAGSRTSAVHRRDTELVVEVVNELTTPVPTGRAPAW